jgi:hypothetical protein
VPDEVLRLSRRNIERVAGHFRGDGLTRGAYLRAALKQPHLFYQKPETLIRNIERVVNHFHKDGFSREKCLSAAVSQPSLFYYAPETIILHINLITGLYRKGLLNLPESAMQRKATPLPSLSTCFTNPHSSPCPKTISPCASDMPAPLPLRCPPEFSCGRPAA